MAGSSEGQHVLPVWNIFQNDIILQALNSTGRKYEKTWIFWSTITKITLSVAYYPFVVDLWGCFLSLVVLFLKDTSFPLP